MSEVISRAPGGGFVFTRPGTPLTPDQTDMLLQHVNNELERTTDLVAEARKRLATAQEAYKRAEAKLLLSEDCPRVGRAAGAVTAAERDAWVLRHLAAEWRAQHEAEVLLTIATDNAWKVKDQLSLVQSLNNNAQSAANGYRGSGR
ncbi:hypothetical protein ABZ897_00430 [Nonomuraea sp. NPDC046802]|uniref:hypothetical protein n=1 Tax=Nonomuraea sp. NPDC046802 TaxID=3154919 RepID=UPI0033DC524D